MLCLAIATAFHEGGRYHRDVSGKSVMMTEGQPGGGRPHGILCDWNYTKEVTADTTKFRLRPVCRSSPLCLCLFLCSNVFLGIVAICFHLYAPKADQET